MKRKVSWSLIFSLLEKYGENIASMKQAYKILLLEKEENTDKLCFVFSYLVF